MNREKLHGLNYADDLMCLVESSEHVQRGLNILAKDVTSFGIYLPPLKCKMLLRDKRLIAQSLILNMGQLTVVAGFTYPGGHATKMVAR